MHNWKISVRLPFIIVTFLGLTHKSFQICWVSNLQRTQLLCQINNQKEMETHNSCDITKCEAVNKTISVHVHDLNIALWQNLLYSPTLPHLYIPFVFEGFWMGVNLLLNSVSFVYNALYHISLFPSLTVCSI